jgi:Autotransporter beta-domain
LLRPFQQRGCSAGSSTVTLTTGSCAIAPNTTLNGSPAVHATTSAQIATNNVTINPFNGGSIGGLAETNGTITFGSGSSINGNWATAASAQTGGQIIFQSGSAINPPFGGGVTALLADGVGPGGQPSHIIATGLAVNMNGAGGNVAGKATGGGIITLNGGTVINFAAGGGGNTGLWATGAGSQIVAIGTNLNMIGGGGGDIGVRADTGANVTLIGGAVNVQSNGGGETGLMGSGAGSSIDAAGLAVNVSNSGGGRGAFLQNGASIAMAGGSLTTSGPGTYGFLFQAPTGVANTLTLIGTEVSSAADAFAVQVGTANITALARFYGQQIDNRYQAFADPRASGWLGGLQGGLDLWRGSFLPGHRDAAGIYMAYGHADVGVNGLVTNPSATGYMLTRTGTLNLDAYSAGGYWTHYGPSGWYIDAHRNRSHAIRATADQRLRLDLFAGGGLSGAVAFRPSLRARTAGSRSSGNR